MHVSIAGMEKQQERRSAPGTGRATLNPSAVTFVS
jgi:hypothetical protein